MNLITRLFDSSLGKKYVMALSGLALFGFVIGHLLGNLQVFGPPDLINAYAHFLKSKPLLIWGARLGLLATVAVHIYVAFKITAENRAARPVQYAAPKSNGATLAARTMILSGSVILAFIVYHLAHFTVLLPGINGVGDFSKLTTVLNGEKVPDVYGMMILGFQVWWVAAFYLIAQALLFMHLGHGLSSLFQSLGFRDHVWWPRIQCVAKVASIAIFVGYAIIPAAIYMRVIGADYSEKVKFSIKQAEAPKSVETAAVLAGEGVK
ncbi:MAG TPA: succinate dehydrogenase cytochrome b subunit [Roseimicrobium sp.]|nr:succinate dehydrogenase cytochrome b subunit [Roseimicrobium sp.]